MAYPAADALSNIENTEGVQKQLYEDWLAATKELPGAVDEATAVIASGVITAASSLIVVDTEASASTDNLDYITTAEGSELRVIVLRATDAGRVVTVRHGQGGIGQILLRDGASAALDSTAKSLVLVLRGTDWVEVARSWLPTASETAAGISERVTQAEAEAGTDDERHLTPLKLRNALNASGSAPVYACRAWVNFNGTGTVEIRAGGNVSSITDNGTGAYTINFATAMPDADYAWALNGRRASGSSDLIIMASLAAPPSASALAIICTNGGASVSVDLEHVTVAIFH